MEDLLARTLFLAAPMAVLAVDREHRIVASNPAAQILFGPVVAVEGANVFALLPGLEVGFFERAESGVGTGIGNPREDRPDAARCRLQIVPPDLSPRWIEIQSVAFSSEGEPVCALFVQDVTTAVEADNAMHLMRNQLGTNWRLNSLGELATLVAHELNQPLAAISNFLYVAGARAGEQNQIRLPIDMAAAQAERASQIIRRFRALTAKQDVYHTRQSPSVLAAEVQPFLALLASEAGVELIIDIDPDACVHCDRIQIQQVLTNLIRNAAVATKGAASGLIRLTGRRVGQEFVWSVMDNGPGVPVALRDTIFRPSVSSTATGLGFGLLICRSIIKAHGGYLRLMETGSAGATFEFTLPITDAQ